MKDKGIDPTTPDGALAAGKLRVDAFTKAGHWDAAQAASTNMVNTQSGVLKAQTADRSTAANNIVLASKGGQLTPAMVSQFHDQFVPDGTMAKGVVMNGDGGFTLTTQDPAGKTSTQTVKGLDVPNLYGMLGSPNATGAIADQLAASAKAKLTAAQTNSANASAGHSSAAADNLRQQTAQGAIVNAQANALQQARVHQNMVGPATEADNALVGAADDAAVSKRARIDPNSTENFRALAQQRVGVEVHTEMLQRQIDSMSPKDPRVAPLQAQLSAALQQHAAILNRLGVLSGIGEAATSAEPQAASSALPPAAAAPANDASRPPLSSFMRNTVPPAAAANTIPTDTAQRKVGQVYTNASGVKAAWTGHGWQTQ